MKPGDTNTFPIIFFTVRLTPCCAVKQAGKVQDQCKSKCYFSLPPSPVCPRPAFCSSAPLLPCHAARCPRHRSVEWRITSCCLFFEKVTLLWDVEKTQQHQLALNSADSLSLPTMQPEMKGSGVCCVGGGGVKGGFLSGSEVSLREENQTEDL